MKYNDNGTYKDIYVKSFDTLPIGAELDYDGERVPRGYVQVADPNTYSTDEVRIGTWIDGKPLYRRVLNFTFTSSDWNSSVRTLSKSTSEIITDINTIDTLLLKNWNIFNIMMPSINLSSMNYSVTYVFTRINMRVSIGTGLDYQDYIGKQNTVIIEYTKTTD